MIIEILRKTQLWKVISTSEFNCEKNICLRVSDKLLLSHRLSPKPKPNKITTTITTITIRADYSMSRVS